MRERRGWKVREEQKFQGKETAKNKGKEYKILYTQTYIYTMNITH